MKIIKRDGWQRTSTLYGHKSVGNMRLSAVEHESKENVRISAPKFLGISLVRMNLPHPVDVIELAFEKNGSALREYVELDTVRNEDELKRDNDIFKTLEIVLNKRDVKSIKTQIFIKEMIDELSCDARFSYKGFEIENSKNTEHSVYIYTLLSLVVATVSIANEFDFKSPMSVFMQKSLGGVTLKFKMDAECLANTAKREVLLKNSKFEAKLAYLSTLCKSEEIKSSVKSVGGAVTFQYTVKEAPHGAPRVYAREDEEKLVFAQLLDAFNPSSNFEPSDDLDDEYLY